MKAEANILMHPLLLCVVAKVDVAQIAFKRDLVVRLIAARTRLTSCTMTRSTHSTALLKPSLIEGCAASTLTKFRNLFRPFDPALPTCGTDKMLSLVYPMRGIGCSSASTRPSKIVSRRFCRSTDSIRVCFKTMRSCYSFTHVAAIFVRFH